MLGTRRWRSSSPERNAIAARASAGPFAHSSARPATWRSRDRAVLDRRWLSNRAEQPNHRMQGMHMCCNDKQRTRHAHVQAYREKISTERRAGERRRRRSLAQRWRRLRRCYGLSRQDYEAMLARQGGACAICKQSPSEPLVVDRAAAPIGGRALLCPRSRSGRPADVRPISNRSTSNWR